MKEREIIKLETKLGYKFKQRELLMRALTHSSFANQERELGLESNERQEFLGDSLLGAIVARTSF